MGTDFDTSEWRRDLQYQLGTPWFEELQREIRGELETAWLRGYRSGQLVGEGVDQSEESQQRAADYAERVVGGSTTPGKPEVER